MPTIKVYWDAGDCLHCQSDSSGTVAETGHNQCVKLLLAHKDVDVNVKKEVGKTQLHYTVAAGKSEGVKSVIVRKNIDVNTQTKYGSTQVHGPVCGRFS